MKRKQLKRAKLIQMHGNKCLKCGTTKDLTIDHVLPISKGGTFAYTNLQVLCRKRNSKKSDKVIDFRKNKR